MTENRKKHLFYSGCIIVWMVIHFLWGKPILSFLSTTVVYWVLAAILVLCLLDEIITIFKNLDCSASETYLKKKTEEIKEKEKKAEPHVSAYEAEGNPIPPAYERNNTPPEDNSHA